MSSSYLFKAAEAEVEVDSVEVAEVVVAVSS